MEKNGRRPLLQLLHPNSSRYFSRDDLASLDLISPRQRTQMAKKEKDKQEDTVTEQSGLEENLIVAVEAVMALSGKCRSWAQGHCSRILSAFLETQDVQVREMAKEELQVLVDEGALKITGTKKPE
ncbi:hypothetical protein IGI04_029027 [Brassica rapa subsp. trilocularis]|uniref:CPL domain-containing protein n=1 Tax=Brassica rapa subsp. trilocularis TaxID=1813537 RepID=A0ABQ7L5U7_BRACM|nr:hypothetical protein IGI04_029027 [Brassica rapa subsp. trilocularis]